MFKNNSNKKVKNGYSDGNGGQPAINIISEGTVIEGTIRTENDFRIAGKIDGHLEVKGKCIVTQTGFVTGDLHAQDADISGKTEGNVVIGNKLFLRQTGHVKGDIHTKTLLIEEGAKFDGACKMSQEPLKAKPANDTKKAAEPAKAESRSNGKVAEAFRAASNG